MARKNIEKETKAESPSLSKDSTTKKRKKKKSKSSMPKLNNLYCPENMTLEQWQIGLRQQQARKENFTISQVDEKYSPGVYKVHNPITRQDYKVVYRGAGSTWNFCSCLDFKTSQLGTCKHLEAVKTWTRKKKKKIHRQEPEYTSVYMDYNGPRRVRIRIGDSHREEFEKLSEEYFDKNLVIRESAFEEFNIFLEKARKIDKSFRCYSDALDYIIEQREKNLRSEMIDSRYKDDVLDSMLTVPLYPYQKEGIRFAIKAGKSIIADEMGLGKTIQAIASAEILMREGLAESVLVVCPTSLKYQWKQEIEKFTGSDQIECEDKYIEDGRPCPKVVVIDGSPAKRDKLYKTKAPYKIVSYQSMANDIRLHSKLMTDVLIMDEIQRLKNWNTMISRAARHIESRYSILLSGTPLENKLEELFATMELADQFCFGPYYKFRNDHIILDGINGKVMGYQHLNSVGQTAGSRLIRRTKKGVRLQLPKRSDEYILVPLTGRQADMHNEFKAEVSKLLRKYERLHFMSEQDRQRLLMLLGQMRMVSDSTYILEQDLKTRSDIKVDETINLLNNIFENGDEKVVIFSEWERMTRLIAMELDKRNIRYEYLHGGIPSRKRGDLVRNFTQGKESRVFLSTDAGSTGLNLQVASTLINMDLPWNPAVLEQRIARIYRLGQQNPVQIINLVSKDSIEEGMIKKLTFKRSMFKGVLDGGEDTVFVDNDKFGKLIEEIGSLMEDTPEPVFEEGYDEEVEAQAETGTEEDVVNEFLQEEDLLGEDDLFTADYLSPEPQTDIPESESPQVPTPTPDNPVSDSYPQRENNNKQGNTGAGPSPTPAKGQVVGQSVQNNPQKLISDGISFLNGLTQTLQSPEATRELVNSIVEVDKTTGETNIRIPVSNKDAVMNVLQLFGKLLG